MIPTIRKLFRYVPLLLSAAILEASYGLSQSHESLYQSHPLEIRNATLSVRGLYWDLPLAGVDSLFLRINELTAKGPCDTTSGEVPRCQVTRLIPPELAVSNLVQVHQSPWRESHLLDADSINGTWYISFRNTRTGDRFAFGDPFHSYYQIVHEYHGQADTVVFAFAFGKARQDVKKWMGYILITK